MDISFNLKTIDFLGTSKAIICQNENGPCPLIALANVLVLQSKIFIHPDHSMISFTALTQLVANCLVETSNDSKNQALGGDAGSVYAQQILNDVLTILPTLIHGLDLNIKFSGVSDFEFTKELSVFDALGIHIYHGWIVDPQDIETASIVQNLSYNQAVNKIVEYHSLSDKQNIEEPPHETAVDTLIDLTHEDTTTTVTTTTAIISQSPPPDAASSSSVNVNPIVNTVVETIKTTASDVTCDSDGDGMSSSYILIDKLNLNDATATSSTTHQTSAADTSTVSSQAIPSSSPTNNSNNNVLELQTETSVSTTTTPTVTVTTPHSHSRIKKTQLQHEGIVIEHFLNETASQFTYEGCHQLHQVMKDNQLAVFFRNNHFSTIFKRNGLLYLLVTDQGYLKVPQIVWEKVNDIMSSEFTDAYFHNFLPFTESQEYRQLLGASTNTSSSVEEQQQQQILLDQINQELQQELQSLMTRAERGEVVDAVRLDFLLNNVRLDHADLSNSITNHNNNTSPGATRQQQQSTVPVVTVQASPVTVGVPVAAPSWAPPHLQSQQQSSSSSSSGSSGGILSVNPQTQRSAAAATTVSTHRPVTTTATTAAATSYHDDYELALQLQREEEEQLRRQQQQQQQQQQNSNNNNRNNNNRNNNNNNNNNATSSNSGHKKSVIDDCNIS